MFKYRGGMVGDPILPEVEWSEEQVKVLADMGLNFAQLNIAWDNRPENEPLNLNDMGEAMLEKFRRRVAVLKKYKMKGMLHFGMPKLKVLLHEANITPYLTPSCISDPETLRENTEMMKKIMRALPGVEDYMFYTYDQHAWLCSEFGNCPKCAGIPLDMRLPGFINAFKAKMAAESPGATFWWQPWELSLGQICETLTKIDGKNFGLMLNTAGSESYFNNLDNHWIRCIGRIAAEKGFPIIAEIQTAGSGVGAVPLSSFPCPTLVGRQIEIVKKLPTFAGVKEHFGYPFTKMSCNMLYYKEYLKNPDAEPADILARTAAYYGKKAAPFLTEAWTLSEYATDFIPFKFTYLYSNIAGISAKHDFHVPNVQGVYADTPAWESDRRAHYLITKDIDYHPWALENAALLFKHSGARFAACAELLEKALRVAEFRQDDLRQQVSDMRRMTEANLGQYYYFKEALLAYDIRVAIFQGDGAKKERMLAEFEELFRLDIENQHGDAEITAKYEEFLADKELFFQKNFRQDERYWSHGYVKKIDQRF